MKIKNILSIAAFSVAFIVSTAFAGLFVDKSEIQPVIAPASGYNARATSCFGHRNKSAAAEKIAGLLKQDIRNGYDRDGKLYRLDSGYVSPFSSSSFAAYSAVTDEYADESGSIEDDRLPREFQTAWRAHMKAWRDYADFLENMKDSTVRTTLGEESFNNLGSAYNTEISRTWFEVLRVADQYGAKIN